MWQIRGHRFAAARASARAKSVLGPSPQKSGGWADRVDRNQRHVSSRKGGIMIKRLWRWLWPPDDLEYERFPHAWNPWILTDEKITNLGMLGTTPVHYVQTRSCARCGLTERAGTYTGIEPCPPEVG